MRENTKKKTKKKRALLTFKVLLSLSLFSYTVYPLVVWTRYLRAKSFFFLFLLLFFSIFPRILTKFIIFINKYRIFSFFFSIKFIKLYLFIACVFFFQRLLNSFISSIMILCYLLYFCLFFFFLHRFVYNLLNEMCNKFTNRRMYVHTYILFGYICVL